MATPSRYWQMIVLTAAGQLRHQNYPQAQQWFKAHFEDDIAANKISDRTCQDSLWRIYQTDPDNAPMAQLCLRCWLSHCIIYTCTQLAQSFGTSYGFQASELWPMVLNDDGALPATYQSFAMEILASYDPKRSALTTWAGRLSKTHPDLNQFLLEHGLYRVTAWAILNDTKLYQLPRFLPHLSQSELAIAERLLKAYHRVYRMDRINQQASRGQRCTTPTDEQLQRIAPSQPPNVVLSQLYDLAEKLRQSRIAARGGPPPSQSIDANEYTEPVAPIPDDMEETQSAFLVKYRQDFLDTLSEAIQATVENYTAQYQTRKLAQGRVYRQALELFHCEGHSMGEIAKILNLKGGQVKVTRLLKLKMFRTEICIYWLNQLKKKVEDKALEHLTANELEAIASELGKILRAETETVMEEAESEAKIPRNRTANSVFARRLCAVVPPMPMPPD